MFYNKDPPSGCGRRHNSRLDYYKYKWPSTNKKIRNSYAHSCSVEFRLNMATKKNYKNLNFTTLQTINNKERTDIAR